MKLKLIVLSMIVALTGLGYVFASEGHDHGEHSEIVLEEGKGSMMEHSGASFDASAIRRLAQDSPERSRGTAHEGDKGFMMGQKGSMKEHHEEGEAESELIIVGNRICPVSGGSVEAMGKPVQVEYNGKIYNLCCKMCAKDFKKNPEKYSKIAEEEVKNR